MIHISELAPTNCCLDVLAVPSPTSALLAESKIHSTLPTRLRELEMGILANWTPWRLEYVSFHSVLIPQDMIGVSRKLKRRTRVVRIVCSLLCLKMPDPNRELEFLRVLDTVGNTIAEMRLLVQNIITLGICRSLSSATRSWFVTRMASATSLPFSDCSRDPAIDSISSMRMHTRSLLSWATVKT